MHLLYGTVKSNILVRLDLIPLQTKLPYVNVNEMPKQVLQNSVWSLSFIKTSYKLPLNGFICNCRLFYYKCSKYDIIIKS